MARANPFLEKIVENGKYMDLVINVDKTMYMKASASEDRRRFENPKNGDISTKGLPQFKYLKETVTCQQRRKKPLGNHG